MIALLTDLSADRVFLLIEDSLFGFRDMAAVLARHVALLLPNLTIFPMQPLGLLRRQFPFFDFLIDPAILIREPIIDLVRPGMILLPL